MTARVGSQNLARLFEHARRDTFQLFSLVPDERDLRLPPAPGFRPIMWHRGHIAAYEAYWLLQKAKGEPSRNPRFDAIFDPIHTPREDASNLPPLDEIDAYIDDTRRAVLEFLEQTGEDDSDLFQLVLQHELQHQETLLYLLHLLDPSAKQRPSGTSDLTRPATGAERGTVTVEGGSFRMGAAGPAFSYDNERPVLAVELPTFRIDRLPVTNAEFAGFVEGGGYAIPELWSEGGFAWVESNAIRHPHSWLPGRSWSVRGLFETRPLDPDEPVWGVSWFEADAYARWAGRRLPTEWEWEYASRGPLSHEFAWGGEPPTAERGNFDNPLGGPTPAGAFSDGASPSGCLDMTGNVWEWTSTPFAGYPGFVADPYPEYSELWFDGDHRVARGGSWATRSPILRASFRNFFRRPFRIGFIGFRCAD